LLPIRVLYLIDRLGRGGAAEVVVSSALALDRKRFWPIVCVTRDMPMNGHDEILQKAGVPLILLRRKTFFDVLSWKRLLNILPTVEILHSHESGSNFWARLLGTFFRVPHIIIQEHTASDEKKPIVRFCDRVLSKLSDRIIAVSEFDRKLLIREEKLAPDKIQTIYNGIDINKFNGELGKQEARRRANLPDKRILLAIIARLVPQKNHASLFKALQQLPEDIKAKGHCLVVGAGPLESELRQKSRDLHLEQMVSFLGNRTDVPVILQGIDLLVVSSHWECLPMTILEALAAKCPMVTTAVGGISEIIGNVGWPLVERDNPQALAKGIEDVFRLNEEQLAGLKEFGRRIVEEKFSKEESVRQLEKLYTSLLGSKEPMGLEKNKEELVKTGNVS